MELILIDNNPDFESSFKKYVEAWKGEEVIEDEDYYSMYKDVFLNYSEFINHIVSLRNFKRIEEGKPYVRFYWFVNDDGIIVGTIRYRLNIPLDFGNIGYEISPLHRRNGHGTKMLNRLIDLLEEEKVRKIEIAISVENLTSQKIVKNNNGRFLRAMTNSKSGLVTNIFEIIIND